MGGTKFGHLSANFGHKTAQKIREFGRGLDTIHGPLSLLMLSVVSVGMCTYRAGVPGGHALLWSAALEIRYRTFDSNGSEHARFHAAIASGGRRFANGNHCGVVQRFRRASRDGGELWDFVVAGDVAAVVR